jgi:hypothetical protein
MPEENVAFLKDYWGNNLTTSDLKYLDEKRCEYKKHYKIDLAAEDTILKYICLTELNAKMCLENGKDFGNSVRFLIELYDAMGIKPADYHY